MRNGILWLVIVILLGIVGVQGWLLLKDHIQWVSTPPKAVATTTTTKVVKKAAAVQEAPPPLSASVSVAVPKAGATVGTDFTVSGSAPGPWYNEATFPISVRDPDGNVIGVAHANAQGDWMTTKLVAFTATVHLDPYSGPAMLILMRDNPSGLPQNDDSTEIAITVKQ